MDKLKTHIHNSGGYVVHCLKMQTCECQFFIFFFFFKFSLSMCIAFKCLFIKWFCLCIWKKKHFFTQINDFYFPLQLNSWTLISMNVDRKNVQIVITLWRFMHGIWILKNTNNECEGKMCVKDFNFDSFQKCRLWSSMNEK